MNRRILLLLILFNVIGYGQKKHDEVYFEAELNHRYGLFDSAGKKILPAIYDKITISKNGQAKMCLDNKCGFINVKNGKRIPLIYNENTSDFYEDLAKIEINGKYGYIDTIGKIIIPPIYSNVSDFSEGLANVGLSENENGFVDKNGVVIIPLKYDNVDGFFRDGFAVVKKANKYALINKEGTEITLFKYDYIFNDFMSSHSFYDVRIGDKYGIINSYGKEIIPVKFDKIFGFYEGNAIVVLEGKYGIINSEGEEMIPCKYDYVWKGPEGIVILKEKDKYFLLDKNDKNAPVLEFDNIEKIKKNLSAFKSNKYDLNDVDKKEIMESNYDSIVDCSDELYIVGKSKGESNFIEDRQIFWGLCKNGVEILSPRYLTIKEFSEGMARVESGKGGYTSRSNGDIIYNLPIAGQWGFIDINGTEVVTAKYSNASDFSEGLAAVEFKYKTRNKWGVIDKSGKSIISLKYDIILNFKNGVACVMLNNKWGLIDNKGKIIIPIIYDSLDKVENE